ncbi:MAG: QacE family quaternary ammonium compound efflux SMR transporter [Ancylobacter novellus]|uniref:QacE family quaternary ammonium compound efflux SMR transporter n=1 Tax=Ancylobacter novellus TaxID=921 RepID=A0A2W5K344_ANCNO|nr:MAG: QacE family quaternary ammonium compound efflux SMR transporter [Ancylobacter novellus]
MTIRRLFYPRRPTHAPWDDPRAQPWFRGRPRGKRRMSWAYLAISVALQIAGVTALKASYGFTSRGAALTGVLTVGASLALLALAIRDVPVSLALAIWACVSAVSIVLISIVFFREPAKPLNLVGTALVLLGCIGLALA